MIAFTQLWWYSTFISSFFFRKYSKQWSTVLWFTLMHSYCFWSDCIFINKWCLCIFGISYRFENTLFNICINVVLHCAHVTQHILLNLKTTKTKEYQWNIQSDIETAKPKINTRRKLSLSLSLSQKLRKNEYRWEGKSSLSLSVCKAMMKTQR